MSKIDQLLNEYGHSHQDTTNKIIHWVCVPMIFFSIVLLLWSIPAWGLREMMGTANPYLNWATIAMVFVFIYYLSLSFSLSVGMLAFGALCLYLAHQLELHAGLPLWAIAIGIFVLAWIGQFWGHRIEGKRPSFFKDLQFLLIGPAWLIHFIYRKAGIPY